MNYLSLFSPKEFDSEYVVNMKHLGSFYKNFLALYERTLLKNICIKDFFFEFSFINFAIFLRVF